MTAKSFFYTSLGIFLLVAAWTMGAQHARADFNPLVDGPIIGSKVGSPNMGSDQIHAKIYAKASRSPD